jgi:hypothetical protein
MRTWVPCSSLPVQGPHHRCRVVGLCQHGRVRLLHLRPRPGLQGGARRVYAGLLQVAPKPREQCTARDTGWPVLLVDCWQDSHDPPLRQRRLVLPLVGPTLPPPHSGPASHLQGGFGRGARYDFNNVDVIKLVNGAPLFFVAKQNNRPAFVSPPFPPHGPCSARFTLFCCVYGTTQSTDTTPCRWTFTLRT